MNSSNSQIKIGAVLGYASLLFMFLSGIVYTPWMLRQIGKSDYGLYALSSSIVSVLALDFGLASAVTKFIAEYRVQKDEEAISQTLGVVFKLYFIFDALLLISLVCVYFFLDKIYVKLTPDELDRFRVVFIIVGAFALVSLPGQAIEGVMTANERFVVQKALDLACRVTCMVVCVCALLCGFKIYALVFITVFTHFWSVFFKFVYLKKNKLLLVDWRFFSKERFLTIFNFSIWILIISVATKFIVNTTTTLLGMTSSSSEITDYSLGLQLNGIIFSISNVISALFLPKISRLYFAEGGADIPAIDAFLQRVGRLQLLFVGGCVAIFALMGREFIDVWLGDGYETVYWAALFLMLSEVFYISFCVAETALTAANEIKYRAFARLLSIVIALPAIYFFSLRWGAIGGALGVAVTSFYYTTFLIFVFRRVLKLDIKNFFKNCYLFLAGPFALFGSVGYFLNAAMKADSWSSFFVKAGTFAVVYFAIMWFCAMNRSEKDLCLSFVKTATNVLPKFVGKRRRS